MKVKPFRVPEQIVLPGLVVQVRQVNRSTPELEGADGSWEYTGGTATIYVCKSMGIKRKRYIILHELQHGMTDYLHDCLDNHADKVKP